MTTMNLTEALAIVKAAGYRVTMPRAKKAKPLGLNAVGKPYSPQYDPNYRMKYRTPPLKRAMGSFSAISPEQWTQMCKLAQAEWDKTHKPVKDDGIPEFLRRDENNKVAA